MTRSTASKYEKFVKDAIEWQHTLQTNENSWDYIRKYTPSNIDIYTDGSHEKHKNSHLGFGASCIFNEKPYIMAGVCTTDLLRSYDVIEKVSNPTAEFIALAEILRTLRQIDANVSNIHFNFYIDYIGIGHWLDGSWKAKKTYIKKIKDECLDHIRYLNIKYTIFHVPSHTGVIGNEMADYLAKSGQTLNTFHELFLILS
jgi:ribonuclease HI